MDEKETKAGRKWRWWLAGAVTGCILVGLAAAAWYFLMGRTIWTDDRGIRRADSEANIRRVLWAPAQALDDSFNTPDQEYEPSSNIEGNVLYFVRGLPGKGADIYVSRRHEGGWSGPKPVESVNTKHDELGPRLSPDGRLLMFYSDRPGGLGQYDIWAARKTADGWGRPFNLGPSVNGKYNDYGPAMGPGGTRLYFATNRKAAARKEKQAWRATIRQTEIGDYDLFSAEVLSPTPQPATAPAASRPASRPATAPAPAGTLLRFAEARELEGLNTVHHEGASCISPGGDFLYFASNRPGGLGGFDLYRCRLRDDRCGQVENLGPEVNTTDNETDPQLGMGGFLIYFSSDREGSLGGYDLFVSRTHEVYATRAPRPLPDLNSPSCKSASSPPCCSISC